MTTNSKYILKLALVLSLLVRVVVLAPFVYAAEWVIVCSEDGCVNDAVDSQLFLEENLSSGDTVEKIIELKNTSNEPVSVTLEFIAQQESILGEQISVTVQDDAINKRIDSVALSELFISEPINIVDLQPQQIQSILITANVGDLTNDYQGTSVRFDITLTFVQDGEVLSTVSLEEQGNENPSVLSAAKSLPFTAITSGNELYLAVWIVTIGLLIRHVVDQNLL